MAKFNKIQVLETTFSSGIVPVFYSSDIEVAKNVVSACYKGGIRVFEFTNRGDFAHEIFSELNRWTIANCPEMIMGIGSIVDAGTASLYMQLGANFIVGPLFNPDIAKVANRRAIPYVPGCATASEIGFALEAGCDLIKIFPAQNVGGHSFIKNLLAPMPWLKLIATGGVELTKENLTAWFKSGVACLGIGSNLFTNAEIKNNEWNTISKRCEETIEIIKKLKIENER
jgi:2-dehydro-3-deoxyphosphogluconate aldolase/(4S)-4-hydroxy-2-oxoglutarate aldolase